MLACPRATSADPDLEPLAPDTDGFADAGEVPVEPPRTLTSGACTLEHDPLQRRFRLHRPEVLADRPPIVVALHGQGDAAASIEQYAGLNDVVDREGLVGVYPQGTSDSWGPSVLEEGYAFTSGEVDDVGVVRAMVDGGSADPGLVGACAIVISNSGDLSYRLACEAEDLFVAVAPVAGCRMEVLRDGRAPAREASVLESDGTED